MEYHVAVTGNDGADGSITSPFRTISKAAQKACAGDIVTVHEGVYREWVRPANGGDHSSNMIVYRGAAGEHVTIKGSEIVTGWENWKGTLWKVSVPDSLFGNYNPFIEPLWGDWLIYPEDRQVHAGDVYLNGKSMYEAESLLALEHPRKRLEGMNPPWTNHAEPILSPEDTLYQWFAQKEDDNTVIYADFRGKDPNKELTEISVRKCCFYPEKTGRNYIRVQGFEMCQAATPWAPPTADQPGLIGTNWSKGWIIEDNVIHDAKCSAVSIGKEYSTGENECSKYRRKPGYQYQMEAVFKAIQKGWSRDTIGSHIIRRNKIYDCGQNAIVGHMGCIFSRIYENEIYNIGVKHEFFGYEIAGIKLHAAIDVQIEKNLIYHCTLGTWLDWQAQGTRVSGNLYMENDRDLMIEVTHGPHIVDNNIFASPYNLDNIAHGGAYIHNLFCGTMRRGPALDRATPYHMPHSTVPLGTTFVYGGDDRWYQNIFIGGQRTYTEESKAGTYDYDGCPSSIAEYKERVAAKGNGDHEIFREVPEPVDIRRNCYLCGARPYEKETDAVESSKDLCVKIIRKEDGLWLTCDVPEELVEQKGQIVTSDMLGTPLIVEERYETPDGEVICFDRDISGDIREDGAIPGPFAKLQKGENTFRLPF